MTAHQHNSAGRELARRAFWSLHPLCDLYAIAHGTWDRGDLVRRTTFSLRELIAFAETQPGDVIARLAAREPVDGNA